jgi:phage/conjugal plasmid C-4 type zinc finger TraR family protein
MTDMFDQATDQEEWFRQLALTAQAAKLPHGISATHCADCGDEIPEARRRAIAGVVRCVDCQKLKERRSRS